MTFGSRGACYKLVERGSGASTALRMTRDEGRGQENTIWNELDVQITVVRQRLKGASAMKLDVSDQALHPGVIGSCEPGDDAAL